MIGAQTAPVFSLIRQLNIDRMNVIIPTFSWPWAAANISETIIAAGHIDINDLNLPYKNPRINSSSKSGATKTNATKIIMSYDVFPVAA